jgi:Spy/CpxP family protein refolding chaperone
MAGNRTHKVPALYGGLTVLLLAVALSAALAAEDPPEQPAPPTEGQLLENVQALQQRLLELTRSGDQEIEKIKEQLAEIERTLRDLQDQREDDELAAIMAEADSLTADEKEREEETEALRESAGGRQRSLQALNPEISVLGDVSFDRSEPEDIQNRFVLRGFEVAFQATLDPYTRFKAFLAAHQEPPLYYPEHGHDGGAEHGLQDEEEHAHEHAEEIGVGVEEIYIEWLALPLGTRLRVGKFRQEFGTVNRWHPHALPSVDLPFALRNLFGHDGLIGLGVGADWQLPRLWASSNGLTVEIVNADNPLAFAGSEFNDPAFLLRHTGFFDISPSSYFELGLNGMIGPNGETDSSDTTLLGFDINYIWEPVQRARYRGVELRGEYIHSSYETDGDTVDADSFYAYVSYKLGRRWVVGFRYDDTELPFPDVELHHEQPFEEGLSERAFSPYLTFWQSEFVRLRFQYQHAWRDFEWEWGPEDDNRVFIQVTFAAGPHKHESY